MTELFDALMLRDAVRRLGWRKLRDSTGARLWRYWRPGQEPQQDGAAGGPAVERDDAF